MMGRFIAGSLALVVLLLLAAVGGAAAPTRSCGNESEIGARLGRVAFLRGQALHVVDLGDCVDRVVARNARAPVRFSADGRWLAFGRANVVAVAGGPVLRPVPKAAYARRSWAWSPRDARLAVVTRGGGLVLTGPSGKVRRLTADGWGAQEVAFAPDGTLTVTRALLSRRRGRWVHQEVWGFAGPNLTPNQLLSTSIGGRQATPKLVTWSPDGRWIFFQLDPFNSASLAADGLPLYVKGPSLGALGPRIVPAVLAYDDYLSWCGNRLVVAAGGDRYATHGKHLIVASPPQPGYGQLWTTRELSRDPRLSWVSPTCSPDGRRAAAAAGRNWVERRFGQEARSLWLLSIDRPGRRRLTAPPAGQTDESPRWSADGRHLLFVRSGPTSKDAAAVGRLYTVRVADRKLFGPLAWVGPTGNYYGHYGWADAVDWYQTRRARTSPAPRSRTLLCFPPAKRPPCGRGARIGVGYAYDLRTHCGIVDAYFDGRWWVAAPPLNDGSGNPPRGWGNPTQRGRMTLVSHNRAEFRAGTLTARFRPAPRAYKPDTCD